MSFSNPEKNIEQFALRLGSSVADFGSGSGHHSLSLAGAVGEKGKVYAVDVQKELLSKLKEEANNKGFFNVEIVWGDLEKIGGTKIADSSVDAVLISNLLFQVEKKENVAEETKRILKKEGKLLVIDWQESFGGIGPHPDQVYEKKSAKALFESKRFIYDREIVAGEHHYGLIFRKA